MVITAFSNVFVQSYINAFGPDHMSGWTAYSKIDALLFLPMQSFALASTTFVGQNYGAGKYRRVRRVVLLCLLLTAGTGLLVGWTAILLRRPLIALYLPEAPAAALLGYERVVTVFSLYFLVGIFEVLSGALQGIKISAAPTAVILLGICGLRLLWILLAFPTAAFHSISGLYLCYPISWAVTSLGLLAMVLYYYPRRCPLSEDVGE